MTRTTICFRCLHISWEQVTVSDDQVETDEITISYIRSLPTPIMGEETSIALSKTYLFRRYQKEAVPMTNTNISLT